MKWHRDCITKDILKTTLHEVIKMDQRALILGFSMLAAGSAMAADPASIDWGKIPATRLTLFLSLIHI